MDEYLATTAAMSSIFSAAYKIKEIVVGANSDDEFKSVQTELNDQIQNLEKGIEAQIKFSSSFLDLIEKYSYATSLAMQYDKVYELLEESQETLEGTSEEAKVGVWRSFRPQIRPHPVIRQNLLVSLTEGIVATNGDDRMKKIVKMAEDIEEDIVECTNILTGDVKFNAFHRKVRSTKKNCDVLASQLKEAINRGIHFLANKNVI